MIQTYKNPTTGAILTADGQQIPSIEEYARRVRAGEISGTPKDVSQMPKVVRTPGGGVGTLTSNLSGLDKLSSNQNFLQAAKDIIQRKSTIQQPLSEAKAYWRTIQRDTSPFGGMRDEALSQPGMITDERLRLLSPADQASVIASRDAAASANLQGISDEEKYRGTREEDLIKSVTDLLTEKDKAEKDAADAKRQSIKDAADAKSQALSDKLSQLNINAKLKELGSDYTFNGDQIVRTFSSATAQNLADAIKQTESGGNYSAKGGSGENGAYQFMPSTWASWSQDYANKVLGKSVGNMAMTKENQDAVAQWKIQSWLDQGMTPQMIAAKWNSGSETGWEKKIGTNSKGVKYDVPAYVNKVLGNLDKIVPANTTVQHVTWTEANARALAAKIPGTDSTTLWATKTDSELDALQKQADGDVVGQIVDKIKPAALLRIGMTQDNAREILQLKQMNMTDDEIKTAMSSLKLDPTKLDELNKLLTSQESTADWMTQLMALSATLNQPVK